MRRRYETEQDRARQRQAIAALCNSFGCDAKASPDLCAWDYEAFREGKMVGLVEVKCRLCKAEQYPTYMISLRKMHDLRKAGEQRGIPVVLLVAWADCIGFVGVETAIGAGLVAHGGRKDRSDPADLEPMLHIPIRLFNPL